MLEFKVDASRCTRCGACAADCPSRIIVQQGRDLPAIAPDRESACLQCQHCLAVCPTAAISIFGRDPARSLPLKPGVFPSLDVMERLVRGRRSVRQYRDENVDPALLQRLLAALANVPTGCNRRGLTFTLMDDRVVMARFRERVLAEIAAAQAAGTLPERFGFLADAPRLYAERGEDILCRGAPHALIVSAPHDAPCPTEDVVLALAQFDLLAQTAGLGTVWWGMFKMILEVLPALKPLVGIPPRHRYYAMLFGRPAVRYVRTVQRDDAAPVRRVAL